MPSNRPFSRLTVALRAAIALAVLLGLTALVVTAGVRPVLDGSAGGSAEAPLLGLVSSAAAACLLALAAVVLRTAVGIVRGRGWENGWENESARGRADGAPLATSRLQRVVAGVLLGAGSLAPQLAAAATVPASGTAVAGLAVSTADGRGSTRQPVAGDAPVDPTYLGPRTPAAPLTAPARPAVPVAPGRATTTVRPGDTLWSIAERVLARDRPHHGADDAQIARAVHALYAANQAAVGADPDLITPGTTLVLPETETLR